jgi:pyrroloquinoline quinone (PQQ) biosynthesis protein C
MELAREASGCDTQDMFEPWREKRFVENRIPDHRQYLKLKLRSGYLTGLFDREELGSSNSLTSDALQMWF